MFRKKDKDKEDKDDKKRSKTRPDSSGPFAQPLDPDALFAYNLTVFKDMTAQVGTVESYLKKCEKKLSAVGASLLKVSQALTQFYGDDDHAIYGSQFSKSTATVNDALGRFQGEMQKFKDELTSYLERLNLLRKQLSEHEKVQQSMKEKEKALQKASSDSKADPKKTEQAQEKYNAAKSEFDRIHPITAKQLDDVVKNKGVDFESRYQLLVDALHSLFDMMATAFAVERPVVNRSAPSSYSSSNPYDSPPAARPGGFVLSPRPDIYNDPYSSNSSSSQPPPLPASSSAPPLPPSNSGPPALPPQYSSGPPPLPPSSNSGPPQLPLHNNSGPPQLPPMNPNSGVPSHNPPAESAGLRPLPGLASTSVPPRPGTAPGGGAPPVPVRSSAPRPPMRSGSVSMTGAGPIPPSGPQVGPPPRPSLHHPAGGPPALPSQSPSAPSIPPSGPTPGQFSACPPKERAQYRQIFEREVGSPDAKMDGGTAFSLLSGSSLPQEDLAAIWEISDQDHDGELTLEEFTLAMYLINAKLRNIIATIPSTPTPDLVISKPTTPYSAPQQSSPSPSVPNHSGSGLSGGYGFNSSELQQKLNSQNASSLQNQAESQAGAYAGRQVGNAAMDRDNQRSVGEAIASRSDNSVVKFGARNSFLQKQAGKVVSDKANDPEAQRKAIDAGKSGAAAGAKYGAAGVRSGAEHYGY